MKIRTIKNPKHSNCIGDRVYSVTSHGKDYYCVIFGSVLFIDHRDVK